MALDEPHDEDSLGDAEGFLFQASQEIRDLITQAGGLIIDWRNSSFGGNFVIRLLGATDGGCG